MFKWLKEAICAMSIQSFSRMFFSPTFKSAAKRTQARKKLNLEKMEDRTVPSTVTGSFSNGVLTLSNPSVAETIAFSQDGTSLKMVTVGGSTFTNTGTSTYEVTAAIIQKIVITGGTAGGTNLDQLGLPDALNNFLTNTTELDITEFNAFSLDLSATTKDLYTVVNLGGSGSNFKTAATGVDIIAFSPQASASSFLIDTSVLTTGVVGLDFRSAVTMAGGSGISVNLNSTNIGGYTNEAITATNPAQITAVYGTVANDVIIGNNSGNLLLGGGGNDTITGGSGNDQLNSTFDFSPAYGGTTGTVAGVPGAVQNNTTIVNPATFATVTTQFNTIAMAASYSPTAIANYDKFGIFNFGSGLAFLSTGTMTSATLGTDSTNANNATVPTATCLLFAGGGNNSIFGFNDTSITANATTGNNVGSTNAKALANTWQLGTGTNVYTVFNGDTVNAGGSMGVNSVYFVGGNASAPSFVTFSAGTSAVQLSGENIQVNVGLSVCTVSATPTGDSSTDQIIYLPSTTFDNINNADKVPSTLVS